MIANGNETVTVSVRSIVNVKMTLH